MTSEQLHLATNHLPFLGVGVAALALGAGVVSGQRLLLIVGLIGVLLTVSSIPLVMGSGESAFQRYQEAPEQFGIDEEGIAWAKVHFLRAEQGSKVIYLTAMLALLSLVVTGVLPENLGTLRILGAVVLLGALASFAVGFWIAEPAGKIRRADFRGGPAPVVEVETKLGGVVPEELDADDMPQLLPGRSPQPANP